MRVFSKFTLFALISLSIFFYCRRFSESVGKARDVVVVAANLDTTLVKDHLQIYQYVPQREPTFVFVFVPDSMLKNINQFHSIFLYGSLKDEFIYELLDAEARQSTLRDSFNLFKIENLWAKNQIVLILVVSESSYMPVAIKRSQNVIRKILEESYYQKAKQSFYEKEMDKKIKTHLHRFGWEMDVPVGWMIDSTYKSENFIYVHAHYPDRSVFLYKEKNTVSLSDSMVIERRNNLTRKYYNGDYVFKELTTVEPVEFQDMKGLRMKGVWQNDSLVAGGPFLSYFLKKNDSLYVVDGILFLPGERKTDYITGIEVMMNSFKRIKQ